MGTYDPSKRPKKLQYLNAMDNESTRRTMSGYYHDLVTSYGINVEYFRKEQNFTTDDGTSGVHSVHIYGEDETAEFYLRAPMQVYMEMQGDSFLLSKFGISTSGDASVYFTIQMFNDQFRDQLGKIAMDYFSSSVVSSIEDGKTVLRGTVINSDLMGKWEYVPTEAELAAGSFDISVTIERDLTMINPDIIFPSYYYEPDRTITPESSVTSGELTGTISVNVDGTCTGTVSGEIEYHIQSPEIEAEGWELAPQVGDFFRFEYGTTRAKIEDYEITRIYDRNLQTDGLNPLLGTYIWRCDVVRRETSHETISAKNDDGSDIENNPADILFPSPEEPKENVVIENASNVIYDYAQTEGGLNPEVDIINQDDIYGGY